MKNNVINVRGQSKKVQVRMLAGMTNQLAKVKKCQSKNLFVEHHIKHFPKRYDSVPAALEFLNTKIVQKKNPKAPKTSTNSINPLHGKKCY